MFDSTVHEHYMDIALTEAKKALSLGDVPVGAIIIKDDIVIAKGYNEKEQKQNAVLHAEICAINEASKRLNSWRLNDCIMYVTLEPCPMCISAIIQARIKTVYFGAYDLTTGACGSKLDLVSEGMFNHNVECWGGVLNEKCSKLIKDFYREKRETAK